MKYLISVILLGALLTGCASAPSLGNATQAAPEGNRGIASIATEGQVTEEIPTEMPGAVVMTANPTPIMLVPIQGNTPVPNSAPTTISRADWQTFTYKALGIDVDYPADWSVTEQTDGATFTSPQGTTILLTAAKATNSGGNEMRMGNQRCLSRSNTYQLTAEVCVETVSFSYSAKFTIAASDGSTQWLTLTTTTRATSAVFEAMFDSVRLMK